MISGRSTADCPGDKASAPCTTRLGDRGLTDAARSQRQPCSSSSRTSQQHISDSMAHLRHSRIRWKSSICGDSESRRVHRQKIVNHALALAAFVFVLAVSGDWLTAVEAQTPGNSDSPSTDVRTLKHGRHRQGEGHHPHSEGHHQAHQGHHRSRQHGERHRSKRQVTTVQLKAVHAAVLPQELNTALAADGEADRIVPQHAGHGSPGSTPSMKAPPRKAPFKQPPTKRLVPPKKPSPAPKKPAPSSQKPSPSPVGKRRAGAAWWRPALPPILGGSASPPPPSPTPPVKSPSPPPLPSPRPRFPSPSRRPRAGGLSPAAPPPPVRRPIGGQGVLNMSSVQDLNDVCSVCTSQQPYDRACNSMSSIMCLAAMRMYLLNLAQIPFSNCDCYTSLARALLQTCPKLDLGVAYIANCDSCAFGTPCPFHSLLFGLPTSSNNVPATTPPVPFAWSIVTLRAQAYNGTSPIMCYSVNPPAATSASGQSLGTIQSIALYQGTAAEAPDDSGSALLTLLDSNAAAAQPSRRTGGCARVPLRVHQKISNQPSDVFVQVTGSGPTGTIRSQLATTLHLYTVLDLTKRSARARLLFDFTVSNNVISFAIKANGGMDPASALSSVALTQGAGAFITTLWQVFGGANGNQPSSQGAALLDTSTINAFLRDPYGTFISVALPSAPDDFISQKLTNSVNLWSSLTSTSVILGSTAVGAGTVSFTVSGGSLCFRSNVRIFRASFQALNLHRGSSGQAGDIVQVLQEAGDPTSNCFALEESLVSQIISAPDQFYVQVQTLEHPFGAIRSQLSWS